MSMFTRNRLLPLLAGLLVVVAAFAGVRSCTPGEEQALLLDAVPRTSMPDADTPADTIKTLTANVSGMTSQLNALRQDNAALRQENRELIEDRAQIESSVVSRLQDMLDERGGEPDAPGLTAALAALSARVEALAGQFREEGAAPSSPGQDIPVGSGPGGSRIPGGAEGSPVWVEPLEHETWQGRDGAMLPGRPDRTWSALDRARPALEPLVERGNGLAGPAGAAVAVYTVPRNATLIGSVGMTALVGRVPVQGQVQDPMPFKVITGSENLAANGLRIPGVEGMIWSGTAIGDWTLSCVSGQLESVTFVFEDGTIRTLFGDDPRSEGSAGGNTKSLGWISDAHGVPCVSGERKTNAPAFLAQRIGVMAMEAAGEAVAQAETTTLVSDSGVTSSVVSGKTGKYVLGKAASRGSDELAQWLRERQAQSFDAVFVPAGVELAIHVDHALPIDFQPDGRKLHHETNLLRTNAAPGGSGLD
ncbi:MAG: TIGR03752 family integrating conjugative element protein [Gammaproteobacteria bacterium]|nr:TIGR03752 family integrating conjugative element protein [Gammaproteobacteria bacterium]